jgi:UDP-2-acetamido-2-deoxy-ribo-hexuluronate aminotransferase
LKAEGIPTAVHYPIPLNMQPAYAHLCSPDGMPNAAQAAKRVMSLPMHADLPAGEVERIASALSRAVAG